MIQHVFRMIWNQRKTNAWIGAELLLISVVLWYVVDFMYATTLLMATPTGFDISHTYKVVFQQVDEQSQAYLPAEQRQTTDADDLQQAIDRIRAYPGVEAVSLSEWAMPYSLGDSWAPLGIDTLSKHAQVRLVTPHFFSVFRLQSQQGKPVEVRPGEGLSSVVLTPDVAEALFPGQEPVGRMAKSPFGSDSSFVKVLEVSKPFRNTRYRRANPGAFFVIREHDLIAGVSPNVEVCIRVAADKDVAGFTQAFRQQMKEPLRIGNLYLMEIVPVADLGAAIDRGRGYTNEVNEYGAIAFFLLVNIFLGILGTFWLRTEGRKGEMGLRIALGSTPARLQRLLIAEGLVLLTLAFVVATLITVNLTLLEIPSTDRMDLSASRFVATTALTYALMAFIITVGVWYPARRTARLAPADALHYE